MGGSGSATAGTLWSEFRFVEIGLFDANVFPVDVEFIGDKHGEMSLDALADLGILAHDGHDAISSNAQKCRRLESSGRSLRGLGKNFSDGVEMESDEDAASNDAGNANKTTPH